MKTLPEKRKREMTASMEDFSKRINSNQNYRIKLDLI